jgi:hypothetical protein
MVNLTLTYQFIKPPAPIWLVGRSDLLPTVNAYEQARLTPLKRALKSTSEMLANSEFWKLNSHSLPSVTKELKHVHDSECVHQCHRTISYSGDNYKVVFSSILPAKTSQVACRGPTNSTTNC